MLVGKRRIRKNDKNPKKRSSPGAGAGKANYETTGAGSPKTLVYKLADLFTKANICFLLACLSVFPDLTYVK